MKLKLAALALVLGLGLFAFTPAVNAAPVSLGTFTFNCLTNNTGFCDSVADQLSLQVLAESAASTDIELRILFSEGAHTGSVTEVYFQNSSPVGALDSFVDFAYPATGVLFKEDTVNGNPLGKGFEIFFAAAEDGTGIGNGVNPGEWLGVQFALSDGFTAGSVLNLLGQPDGMNVGLHIQSIDGGTSEKMAVPEPASMLLLGAGLLGAGVFRRRRSR